MKNLLNHPSDQIVEFMSRIYSHAMTTTSGGNLSILDDNGDMWISPGSVDKGTLTRDDIVCVKADGTIIGKHKPSSEFPFHRDIYKKRPDVKAIVHAHPPALVAFSIAAKIPDTKVLANIYDICGEVGYADYACPGSDELGAKVSAAFAAGHNTILLENHGTCNAGRTLMEAFQRFETLDYCARTIGNATVIGTPKFLTQEQGAEALKDRNTAFTACDRLTHTTEEIECRIGIIKLVHRSYKQQLFTSTQGVYAARLDADRFLITPGGADPATLTVDDLVLVNGTNYESGKTLSPDAWFCRMLFDAQPEINSIMIAQPASIMAYAVAGIQFDARTIPESYILLRDMPLFDFGYRFDNTADLCKTINLRNPVVSVQNDCVITTGRSLLESFDRLEVADFSARAVLQSVPVGKVQPINARQVAELIQAFKLID